jgi:hypothetical protein
MFLNSKPKVGLPEKLGRIAAVAVFVLLLLFLLPLACRSLWDTATIDRNNSVIERTGFEADFLLFNLLALLAGIVALYLLRRLLRNPLRLYRRPRRSGLRQGSALCRLP